MSIFKKKDSASWVLMLVLGVILLTARIIPVSAPAVDQDKSNQAINENAAIIATLENKVIPPSGVVLPVVWGDFGVELVDAGVIDADKLISLYRDRGLFEDSYTALLLGRNNGKLKITRDNASYWLNLLWAFGLANKNRILETNEMLNSENGGAGRFASTGGWTLAKGDPMDHYNQHNFVELTTNQQAVVDRMAHGIYRPCCNNSTYFPDCNHGMAMLGLLELMAFQDVPEDEMWRMALAVNSYWFSDTYLTIAQYFNNQNIDWDNADPKVILGEEYSSASGYRQLLTKVDPIQLNTNGACAA